ncbi:MAG: hypothetical protein ABR511_04765 [Acidimicrobiales bacterium]
MELAGREGNRMGLTLVGYEHPDATVDPWESNSLLVDVRVLSPQGSWEVVDPCLTTWEAAHLVGWLATVAVAPERAAASVAEPNLTMSAARRPGGRVAVTACFELERRPPWLGSGNLCVEVEVGTADLVSAAVALRADLARFPRRGDDPTL